MIYEDGGWNDYCRHCGNQYEEVEVMIRYFPIDGGVAYSCLECMADGFRRMEAQST